MYTYVHVQWTKDTLIDPESITIFYVTVIKHWRAVLSKLYILNKYDSISEYQRNNKIDTKVFFICTNKQSYWRYFKRKNVRKDKLRFSEEL